MAAMDLDKGGLLAAVMEEEDDNGGSGGRRGLARWERGWRGSGLSDVGRRWWWGVFASNSSDNRWWLEVVWQDGKEDGEREGCGRWRLLLWVNVVVGTCRCMEE